MQAKQGKNDRNAPIRQRGVYLNREAKRKIAMATLVLLAIILVFAALQPVFFPYSNSQKYSELGILGPNMTIGKYPTSVIQNQSFTLYGYLENQKGTAQYYEVLVKLGNQSTMLSNTTYANAPVIAQYYAALNNNNQPPYTFPITLTLSQPGTSVLLIFELWEYKITATGGSFVYTGVSDHISLSVNP